MPLAQVYTHVSVLIPKFELWITSVLLKSPMASALAGGILNKHFRSRRGSDVDVLTAPVASGRRNCLVGGFPGPKARPSVIFSTQKLGVTVGGCAALYSAVLSCAPEHSVTVSPGNLPACIRVSPSLAVFSPENWMTPQFFRVAVLSAVYDDNNKDDRKLQVIEHVSSSEDARFSGNRVVFLPSNVLVQVSGREGCYLLSSGSSIGTATELIKPSTSSWPTRHEFALVDLEVPTTAAANYSAVPGSPTSGSAYSSPSTRELTNRASSASNQPLSAGGTGHDSTTSLTQEVTVTTKRATSPRQTVLSGSASSASLVPSIQNIGDGSYHSIPRDGVATVKIVARAQHTAVLFKSGKWGLLGKMDVDYTSEEKDTDITSVNGSRGSNAALSRMLVDIECGDAHVAALTEQGYVLTWGEGSHGRLGHGALFSVRRPQAIKSLFHKRIVHLACGAQHTIAAAEDGDVYSWGYGKCGALGHGRSEKDQAFDSVSMPMEVLSLKSKGVARIACGDAHSAVVLLNGLLLTCGWGEHGRLGRPFGNEFSSYFERVAGGALKKKLCTFVSCGGAHTLVLTECKSLLAFGWNVNGQLGVGDRRNRPLPTKVQYFDVDDLILTSVAAGKLHSMALTQDARVFAWGSDELGQSGVGSFPQLYTVPHLVASTVGLNVTQISAGEGHSVALSTASHKQLDAMQSNHPARYSTLEDTFELFMKSDLEQQSRVLTHAKQAQLQRALDTRKRKPPVDPSSSLARTLQAQCRLESDLAVQFGEAAISCRTVSSGRATSNRPRTAGAVLRSPTKAEAAGRDAELLRASQKPPTFTVRCSSATLWRQTRLFSFQQQQQQTFITKDAGAAPTATRRRPVSASPGVSSNLQAKLSSETRRSLATMIDGDWQSTLRQQQKMPPSTPTGNQQQQQASETPNAAGSNHASLHHHPNEPKHSALASFPLSRPTSAPSHTRSSTKTS